MTLRYMGCLMLEASTSVFKRYRCCVTEACVRNIKGKYHINPKTTAHIQLPNLTSKARNHSNIWLLGALSLFGFFEKKEEDSELEILVKRGILAIQEEDPNKAEQFFHLALKLAQDLEDDMAVTVICDMMANLAFERKELEKAEKLFKNVLSRILNTGTEPEDNAVVHISLKLANIYAQMGDPEKANEGFKFCIDTQERKIKNMDNLDTDTLALWAMSVDWYARFLVYQQKHDYAEKYFMQALEVCRTLNGSEHPQTAILLNDLATVCTLQEKYAEATEYAEEAVQIGKVLSIEELAAFYVNKGIIELRSGMVFKAKSSCQLGLNTAKYHKNKLYIDEANECLNLIENVMRDANQHKQ